LRELPLQPLEFAQETPELLSLHRPLPRTFVRIAPEREGARRVADPLDVEAGDLLLEATLLQHDHLGRNEDVLEVDLRPLLARHELRGLAEAYALRLRIDQHRADATHARAVAHVGEDHFCVWRVRGEHLGAAHSIAVALWSRRRLEIGHRGACFRLGHPHRAYGPPGEQAFQILLFLLRRAVLGEHTDRPEVARLDDAGA